MQTLKEKRLERKLTQVDMAKILGVSLTSYRMYEYGIQTPGEETRKKLEEVLGKEE